MSLFLYWFPFTLLFLFRLCFRFQFWFLLLFPFLFPILVSGFSRHPLYSPRLNTNFVYNSHALYIMACSVSLQCVRCSSRIFKGYQ